MFSKNSKSDYKRQYVSPTFLIKTLLASLTLIEFVNGALFTANNSNYSLTSTDDNSSSIYFGVFTNVYIDLYLGACNSTRLRKGNLTGTTVISAPGVNIEKDSYFTETPIDNCLRALVQAAVDLARNLSLVTRTQRPQSPTTKLPEDDNYRRNIIWGTIFSIIGISLLLVVAYLGYAGYRWHQARRPAPAALVEAQAPEAPAAVPRVSAADQEQELSEIVVKQETFRNPGL